MTQANQATLSVRLDSEDKKNSKNHYHIDYPIYIIDVAGNAKLAHKTKGWIVSDPRN